MTFSHYRIEHEIGRGGMGVVYAAVDTRLGRRVAIKTLPPEATADPDRRRRFMQEARAASALNHPGIVTIYEVDEEAGATFIAMELVEGTPLDRLIADGPLPIDTALDYALQAAAALEAAHAAGIVHRDIKPANMMVTRDGRVKVLDFGLAKLTEHPSSDATRTGTRAGMIMGTAAYMSPEQAEGRPVDARSDIFSFGAVLYEMLGGRRAFTGESDLAVLSGILHAAPPPLRSIRPEIPREIDALVQRTVEKSPETRYQTAAALRADLRRLTHRGEPRWRRPSMLVPAGLVIAGVIGFGAWQTVQARGVRWARGEAIPQIERLQGTPKTMEAVRLARAAERYAPDDIGRMRQSWQRVQLTTEPAGATVTAKNYTDVSGEWESLGVSPVTTVLPFGYYRIHVEKPGYLPIDVAALAPPMLRLTLTPADQAPAGMVKIEGGKYGYGELQAATLPPFWIDRLEVTNRAFKTFVDAGGYRDPKYWREPFKSGDSELTFQDAIGRFRDSTGRPGPATWELGTFPQGQEDFPVGGISWFEANAYARFAGKQLPTVYHWYRASGAEEIYSDILALSNYDGKGPVRAGERSGISPSGVLDMAGNVKEWCVNPAQGTARRYIMGGGWNEPNYRFTEPDAQDPWNRGAAYGVRLVTNLGDAGGLDIPVGRIKPDPRTVVPASDAEFDIYKRFYTYDRDTPLDARVTAVDDASPDWRKETVNFAAAYGNERVPAYFFTPKNARPPYQTIVVFPSGFARVASSSARLDYVAFEFLIKSGRAVLYPVYQGTFERRGGAAPGPSGMRDLGVQWAKDFFRAVDYLETRPDVDKQRLAYYSLSMGAYFGPIPVSLEPRIKVAVFSSAGLRYNYPQEIQPANFMPRVKVPVLMVNGRDDFSAPVAAQDRVYELLGTPAADKQHIILDGGHVPNDYHQVYRAVLDWYDKYLGPVK